MRGPARIRRVVAAVFLLTTLCVGTLALPHDDGFADFACSPVPVAHDESAHYIGAVSSSASGETQHCFLCHSFRPFCRTFEKYEQRDSSIRAERLHAAPIVFAGEPEWSLTPGRAPPA